MQEGRQRSLRGAGPRSGSEPGRVPGVGDSADCRASERGRAGFVPGVLLTPAVCPSGCRVLSAATSRPLEQSPVRSRYLNTFRVENPPSFHSATKGIAATGWRRTPASGDLETCEEHLKTGPNLLCSQEGGRFWSPQRKPLQHLTGTRWTESDWVLARVGGSPPFPPPQEGVWV